MLQSFTNYLNQGVTPGQYTDPVMGTVWAVIYILIIFGGASIAVMAILHRRSSAPARRHPD